MRVIPFIVTALAVTACLISWVAGFLLGCKHAGNLLARYQRMLVARGVDRETVADALEDVKPGN